MNRIHLLLLGLLASSPSLAQETPLRVSGFDDTRVEIRKDDGFSEIETSAFPPPPLDVLGVDDANNLVQLQLRSGETVWVDRSYLIMEKSGLSKKSCGVRTLARDETKLYGVRGIGEGCE
ncbi:MAG: hypothetical protein LPK85_06135 [Gammaproteobacteria bacterium]|nr:hypothetical protein [Gammaproteobacteria bacterium]